ncbi:MAG: hypothetical protein IH960_08315, partial [Chloroflexi bacterium]|nr:hypothetical protein [Chloroflexota bacterium]
MADVRIIARWLAEDQLEGRRRSVTVGPDQVAVVIRNGAYGEPQSETRVDTRGRFGGKSGRVEVLVASLAPFTVEYELDEIAGARGALRSGIPIVTHDNKAVSGSVRLTLAVNPDRPDLLSQLRNGRAAITDGDVEFAIRDEFLTQVIRTTVAEIDSSDLRASSKQFIAFYQETQTQLESQLTNYGLMLRNFAIAAIPTETAMSAERQQIERRRQLEQADQEFGTPKRPEAPARPAPPPPPTQAPTAMPSADDGKSGGGKGKWFLAGGILVAGAAIIAALAGTFGSSGGDVVIVVAPTATLAPPSNRSPSSTAQPELAASTATLVPATSPTVTRVPAPDPSPTATGPRDLPDMEVAFSHSSVGSRTAEPNGGIRPGETLVIDIVTQPGARVEFSFSLRDPYREVKGESLADFFTQFGALVSSAPEEYTEKMLRLFRGEFPGEEIPFGGWDHSICIADERGNCQFRWLLGTADFLMDPYPNDDNPSNVEIV